LKLKDEDVQIDICRNTIKKVLLKNPFKGENEFPSVAQMATDSNK
jgi:hypothetical protein